jgi:eukaryotic-like serine/threonine-protein kinase
MDATLAYLRKIPFGAAIAVLAVAGLWGMSSSASAPVRVPDVVGHPVPTAQKIASADGYGTRVVYVARGGVAGTVVAQRPEARAIAKRGTQIELDVTKGAQQIRVPDLRDMPTDDARFVLRRGKLTPGDVIYERRPGKEMGRVITTRPGPGAVVDIGSRIDLVVAS